MNPGRGQRHSNPGAGAEVLVLQNSNWVLINNDLERGRHSLAVSRSEDEGRTWRWTRHLERDSTPSPDAQQNGQYHYPSIIQAADGTLHATYSYFAPPGSVTPDAEGRRPRKAIKHAHFNEAWIKGDRRGLQGPGVKAKGRRQKGEGKRGKRKSRRAKTAERAKGEGKREKA